MWVEPIYKSCGHYICDNCGKKSPPFEGWLKVNWCEEESTGEDPYGDYVTKHDLCSIECLIEYFRKKKRKLKAKK